MKSGFIETANKLQKRLDDVEQMDRNKEEREKKNNRTSSNRKKGNNKGKYKGSNSIKDLIGKASNSELTIYKNAVENQISKRFSLSSSEGEINTSDEINVSNESVKKINTSDEFVESDETMDMLNDSLIEQYISDMREQQFPMDQCFWEEGSDRWDRDQQERYNKPSSSRERQLSPEEKAELLVREAEASKARILEVPGKDKFVQFNQAVVPNYEIDLSNEFVHSAMVDENYQLVASHLEESIQMKIIRGEYVDFGRLVPKDRVMTVDDSRYEMIVRDGKTYWVPASNNEATDISSYNRWEQAFRVFSDVYVRAFPHRASELVQYSHLIHTASQTYIWENVYMYDKDFHLHLSRYPKRSWSIILQQAWAVRLKDKLKNGPTNFNSTGGQTRNEICKRYNKGKCLYSSECNFEHRCSFCFKFGHSVINCRRLRAIVGSKDRDRRDYDGRRDRDREGYHHRERYHDRHEYASSHHRRSDGSYQNKNNSNNNKVIKKEKKT